MSLSALVSLVVGLVVSYEMGSYLSRNAPIEAPRYLTAIRNLPPGQPVSALNFTMTPASRLTPPIPPGALSDQEIHLVRNMVTATTLREGAILTREALRGAGDGGLGNAVPKGMRIYRLTEPSALPLVRGDLVDVLWTPRDTAGTTVAIVEGLQVLGMEKAGEPLVAASSPQIQILEKGRRQGKLTLVLRNPTDRSNAEAMTAAGKRLLRTGSSGGRRVRIFVEGE